jgi:hypothetical protein
MRSADVFAAGALTGALFVWLWGEDIENFLRAKTRDARTHTADAIGVVADTVRA